MRFYLQILEATTNKTAIVRPLTSHLEKHFKKDELDMLSTVGEVSTIS